MYITHIAAKQTQHQIKPYKVVIFMFSSKTRQAITYMANAQTLSGNLQRRAKQYSYYSAAVLDLATFTSRTV